MFENLFKSKNSLYFITLNDVNFELMREIQYFQLYFY